MKEAVRVNPGKFDRNVPRVATDYLSFNPDAQLAASLGTLSRALKPPLLEEDILQH